MRHEKRTPSRVVVDVNVLVSFLIGRRLRGFVSMLSLSGAQILISKELLAELAEVLERPRLRKYFTLAEAREFVLLLEGLGFLVDTKVNAPKPLSRDPKDDYLLLMARKGKANVLVTGDKDLLVLDPFGGTRIMDARKFTDEYLK